MLLGDLETLIPLFDQYLVFYEKSSQPERYRSYLESRLSREEAVVFGFFDGNDCLAGFVLNYFSFSSVALGNLCTGPSN
jgi:hypothetical protein